MNYIGSKLSLLDFLKKSILSVIKNDSANTFCDLFAGTGTVGILFKKLGFKIISNDIQYYSYILNKHYIENNTDLMFNNFKRDKNIFDYLNNLNLIKDGFIYTNYSPSGTINQEFKRIYFTDYNAQKCDTIRINIEQLYNNNEINENEYYFLLTSLIESIDKYANTTSVYGAFLKQIKNSAAKHFIINPANIILGSQKNEVYNTNANYLIDKINTDILYLDPPYNARQYCSNYHLLETITKYDNPIIKGKTGLRDYTLQKSEFCSKSKVIKAFKNIIEKTNAKYIFLSYNNEGLMRFEEIKSILSSRGEYGFFEINYSRFKADNKRNYFKNNTTEYLHYCKCK